MIHNILIYLLGLCTPFVAVLVGDQFKKQNDPDYSYICPEENCEFAVQSDERGKVDNAVASHWRFHP
jgi:hypothetical protein